MTQVERAERPGFVEFVALTALMIALVALSIDMMLPALPAIGEELGVTRANDNQLIISLLFLGMAAGQIVYGPLSDSIGRKPAIYAGLVLFIVGCLVALMATDFRTMLAGRLLQGLGVAGPRSVMVAVVRDRFEGRSMARVMSFVMAVFIIVPVIAPAIGQVIILFLNWRAVFVVYLLLSIVMMVWFGIRLPETLAHESRLPISGRRILAALREVLGTRVALGYTLAAGLVSGAFLGFLSSAQQIFQELYALGAQFPLYFAMVALASGLASYLNGRLVMHFGMRLLSRWAVLALIAGAAFFLVIVLGASGVPPLWTTIAYFLVTFFSVGILFGNLNSLAMEPLGHIAGTGAAVVGALSTFLSVPLGIAIGQSYNDTMLPLTLGFLLLGALSLATMRWADAERSPTASG